MTNPTPLEIAAALRSTAEFCRQPDSPKTQGRYACDALGNECDPEGPTAANWCAVGWFSKEVGLDLNAAEDILPPCRITRMFDNGYHCDVAAVLDDQAAQIEAGIPTQARQPAEQREAQHV